MELHLPMALQVALYAASGGIVVLVTCALLSLFYLHRKIERIVQFVKDLKAEVEPLARETRAMVQGVQTLTDHIREKLYVLEEMHDTAQYWRRRVDLLLAESRAVIAAPLIMAGRKLGVLLRGLFTRSPQHQ